ncbi:Hypothetical Protein sle_03830 [Streptomyces leeuwenhoekii]|uniref:Uncharacterized protein n=1 Tax=Streptomyces leeuwenhoekii TaxID=1437453 RepID=A0A0F7VLR4_STRLW|nr:Hypothetical Protein sle_03830 [Streptomyces leeuwenhoekii]
MVEFLRSGMFPVSSRQGSLARFRPSGAALADASVAGIAGGTEDGCAGAAELRRQVETARSDSRGGSGVGASGDRPGGARRSPGRSGHDGSARSGRGGSVRRSARGGIGGGPGGPWRQLAPAKPQPMPPAHRGQPCPEQPGQRTWTGPGCDQPGLFSMTWLTVHREVFRRLVRGRLGAAAAAQVSGSGRGWSALPTASLATASMLQCRRFGREEYARSRCMAHRPRSPPDAPYSHSSYQATCSARPTRVYASAPSEPEISRLVELDSPHARTRSGCRAANAPHWHRQALQSRPHPRIRVRIRF